MAEYMDISRIDDLNDLSIIDDDGNAAYFYDAGELPRADVIEREKIDKAIEEIHLYEHENGDMFDRGMMKALGIFVRNIEGI